MGRRDLALPVPRRLGRRVDACWASVPSSAIVQVLRIATRLTAITATGVGGAALVADLGRPERFLNMMRVFKVSSPMSLGTWILSGFGVGSGVLAAIEVDRLTGLRLPAGAAASNSACFRDACGARVGTLRHSSGRVHRSAPRRHRGPHLERRRPQRSLLRLRVLGRRGRRRHCDGSGSRAGDWAGAPARAGRCRRRGRSRWIG